MIGKAEVNSFEDYFFSSELSVFAPLREECPNPRFFDS